MLTSDQLTGAEVRTRLEAVCGGEPSKTEVLDLLATAVQSSEYSWFVVTDIEPAASVRALSPSAIKDKGLDSLHILPREPPMRSASSPHSHCHRQDLHRERPRRRGHADPA